MKIRMTTSFLYSLVLHLTILVLALALFWVSKSDAEPVREKRCKIMLNQVCECPPEKAVKEPVESNEQNKPKAAKKTAKPRAEKTMAEPVVEKKVVLQDAPDVKESENDEKPADEVPCEVMQEEAAAVAEDDRPKEPIITTDAAASQAPPAQQAVEMPPDEHVSPEDAYVEAHLAEIMALLRDNLYYPRMARKRHIEGKVMVRFELLKNGEIENITVVEAQRDILARSAVKTIERLDGKFPLPSQRLVLNVPIVYNLH